MSIPPELWAANTPVGGNGGAEFKLIGEKGSFVRKIKVYYGTMKWGSGRRGCVNGIEVVFTNGQTSSTGDTAASLSFHECFIDVGKDERLKSMSLWGMGSGKWDRTSCLRFETNKGQTLEAGSKAANESEYKMDIGSGLLLGFQGRSGGSIDCIAPILLKPVLKQYIDNITYPGLDLNNTGFLQMKYLDRAKAEWDGVGFKATIRGERSEQMTKTWNNKFTIDSSVELAWTAGVPFMANQETKITLGLGYQRDWGHSESETKNLVWQVEKEVKSAEDQFELLATYYTGKQQLEYKGTYNVITNDQQKFSFETSGTLENVIVSEVVVKARQYREDGSVEDRAIVDEDDAEIPVDEYLNGEERSLDDEVDTTEYLNDEPGNGYVETSNEEESYPTDGADDAGVEAAGVETFDEEESYPIDGGDDAGVEAAGMETFNEEERYPTDGDDDTGDPDLAPEVEDENETNAGDQYVATESPDYDYDEPSDSLFEQDKDTAEPQVFVQDSEGNEEVPNRYAQDAYEPYRAEYSDPVPENASKEDEYAYDPELPSLLSQSGLSDRQEYTDNYDQQDGYAGDRESTGMQGVEDRGYYDRY